MSTKPHESDAPPPAAKEGPFEMGEGSTPIPNDPAVTDPLKHLDDVTEGTPPTPGEGLPPDEVVAPPAPVPSPPEPETGKGPGHLGPHHHKG